MPANTLAPFDIKNSFPNTMPVYMYRIQNEDANVLNVVAGAINVFWLGDTFTTLTVGYNEFNRKTAFATDFDNTDTTGLKYVQTVQCFTNDDMPPASEMSRYIFCIRKIN